MTAREAKGVRTVNMLDERGLKQIETHARGCPDACSADVMRLTREVRRLRKALAPLARHSLGGWDIRSGRRYQIRVTEGQVARAWRALNDPDWTP